MKGMRAGEGGAALLTVLSVLAVLGIVTALLLERARPNLQAWSREAQDLQALYVAESGIAHQLYLERYSDSADPEMGKPGKDSLAIEPDPLAGPEEASADSFVFRLDAALGIPEVTVDRSRAWLDISSRAVFRGAKASVSARFGKALDDSVFGAALTLDNAEPLEPFPGGAIVGSIRLKTPIQGFPTEPYPAGFSVLAYTAQFTDKKYHVFENALVKQLAAEGVTTGNGSFDPRHPPDFKRGKEGDLIHALGQVEIRNDDDETWVIRGPGRIIAEYEIRVKGLVRFENVSLISGKDVTLEDSVSGEGFSVYARGSIFVHGRCHAEIEAVAGKDIILQDKSQTAPGSVLLSVGQGKVAKGADTLNAIRIVNEAVARGFLIAGGANGRVVLGTALNRVEGVVMAQSVWLAGSVEGPVLAGKLLCDGTNTRNCLGTGRIDRSRLPRDFIQPLELGPQDRRSYRFRLLEWKRI